MQLGLVRLIEIVGEAAAHVSTETRNVSPDIPWAQIVSTRNRLIHGYDFVDFDILWKTIEVDLPDLIRALKRLLESNRP